MCWNNGIPSLQQTSKDFGESVSQFIKALLVHQQFNKNVFLYNYFKCTLVMANMTSRLGHYVNILCNLKVNAQGLLCAVSLLVRS